MQMVMESRRRRQKNRGDQSRVRGLDETHEGEAEVIEEEATQELRQRRQHHRNPVSIQRPTDGQAQCRSEAPASAGAAAAPRPGSGTRRDHRPYARDGHALQGGELGTRTDGTIKHRSTWSREATTGSRG